MSNFCPYHALDARGSKHPHWLTDRLGGVSRESVSSAAPPPIDRRTALKLAAAGTAWASLHVARRSAASVPKPSPVFQYWFGQVAVATTILWVCNKFIPDVLEAFVDPAKGKAAKGAGAYANVLGRALALKEGLAPVEEMGRKPLPQEPPGTAHRESADRYYVKDRAAWVSAGEGKFGVREYIQPIDLPTSIWKLNKIEMKAAEEEWQPILPTALRQPPDESRKLKGAFSRAIKVYDLDTEIALEDIWYVQRCRDSDGKPAYAFGFPSALVVQTNLPGLIS